MESERMVQRESDSVDGTIEAYAALLPAAVERRKREYAMKMAEVVGATSVERTVRHPLAVIRPITSPSTASARLTGVAVVGVGEVDAETPLGWQADALCTQVDPDIFFPEKGGTTRPPKSVCSECDVVADCLQYALDEDIQHGIWGGYSERERRRLKKLGLTAEQALESHLSKPTSAVY